MLLEECFNGNTPLMVETGEIRIYFLFVAKIVTLGTSLYAVGAQYSLFEFENSMSLSSFFGHHSLSLCWEDNPFVLL